MSETRKTAVAQRQDIARGSDKSKRAPNEMQCAIKGTRVCPYPFSCTGFTPRRCDKWQHCSGR